jgi:hypothetical protein
MKPISIFVFGLFLLFSACRKECKYLDLPDIECSSGYASVDNANLIVHCCLYNANNQTEFIINDDSAYAAIEYPNGEKPFGDIDFTTTTILGRYVKTNPANDWKYQHYLCKNESQNSWKYKIEYSLRNQCAGSSIDNIQGYFFVICPKIPSTASITIEAVDINPF